MADIQNNSNTTSVGNFKILDGKTLVYKSRFFLFFKTKHSVALDKIVGIIPQKGLFSTYLKIYDITPEDDAFPNMVKDEKAIVKPDQIPAVLKMLKDTGKVPFFEEEKYIFTPDGKPHLDSVLELKGDIVGKKHDILVLYKERAVPLLHDNIFEDTYKYEEDIRYFNNSGSSVNFGYKNNCAVRDVNKEQREVLKAQLIKRGAKIEVKPGEEFKGSLLFLKWLNPLNWSRKETLIFTDDALIFNIKTARKAETIYLPFSDVSTVVVKDGNLDIKGRQNITGKLKFSKKVCKKLSAIMLKDTEGYNNTVESRFKLLGIIPLWRRKGNGHIQYSDNGLLIYPSNEDRKAHDMLNPKEKMPEFYKIAPNLVSGVATKGSLFNKKVLVLGLNTNNVRSEDSINGDQFSDGTILVFKKVSGGKDLKELLTSKYNRPVIKKKTVKKILSK